MRPGALLRPAVETALRRPHLVTARLYTDGQSVKWLPRPLPGWERICIRVKPAQEKLPCAA